MLSLLNKNFATVAMLAALALVLVATCVLLMSGKLVASDPVATGLVSSVSTVIGGIAGFSINKQTEKMDPNTTVLSIKGPDEGAGSPTAVNLSA